jgi:hypothetical protein
LRPIATNPGQDCEGDSFVVRQRLGEGEEIVLPVNQSSPGIK